jgi:hypothetical protein
MKRPFQNGRIHLRLDILRRLSIAATPHEEKKRKIGPRRLVSYRLAEPFAIYSIERIVGYDRAGGQAFRQRGQKHLAVAIDDRFHCGALQ